jgi:Tol biopolymer transport system component
MAWSPDGRSIAFASYGRLRKVVVAGGSPEAISPPSSFAGGVGARSMAWGPDGTIFFADNRGFWRATADGGIPATLAMRSADEAHDATGFLPDGRHFLLSVASSDLEKAGTFVVAVDGSDRRRILAFPSWAQYAMGRLIFVREQILYAQPFDTANRQLSGAAVPLAESAADRFSASNTGSVAYLPLDSSEQPNVSELVWMDRRGGLLGRIDQAAGAISPALSPDGRRLAMVLRGDIWTFELSRSVMSKVTTERAAAPTWSPDGKRILFYRSLFTGLKDAILESAPGSGEKTAVVLVPADGNGDHAHPNDISADGRYLAYEGNDARDIWVMPLTGDRMARAFIEGPSSETQPMFSPDGRWLAYSSNATGGFEVYVQRFPASGARLQVSPGGGGSARWSRDGTELFYLAPDGSLTAVPVRAGATIEFGQPKALFKFFSSQRGTPTQKPQYDVTADGQRFIVSSVPRRDDPSIQVVLNWPVLTAAEREP